MLGPLILALSFFLFGQKKDPSMLWYGEVTYHGRLHGMAYAASISILD
jgi:hypothetical protein